MPTIDRAYQQEDIDAAGGKPDLSAHGYIVHPEGEIVAPRHMTVEEKKAWLETNIRYAPSKILITNDQGYGCGHVVSETVLAANNSDLLTDPTLVAINKSLSITGDVALLTLTSPTVVCTDLAGDLKVGSKGEDVKKLQVFLNTSSDTHVAEIGAGAPGRETTVFNAAVRTAVIKFQEKYAADILAPVKRTKGTGSVDSFTRAKIKSLSCATY